MCNALRQVSRIVISMALSSALLSVSASEAKPDKRKSQALYQRGVRADETGKRDEAIAAYSEALKADQGNFAAWRARGKDYLAAGDLVNALGDLEMAVQLQPGDAGSYAALGDYFLAAR